MRHSLIAVTCLAALGLPRQAAAADEPYMLTIPNQGWYVSFESPPLREFQGQTRGKSFVFQATEKKAFNLSLFVEEPKNKEAGHDACFNHYWPLAKRNPLIDQDSVKIEKLPKFVKVTYLIKSAGAPGLNVNYYFAFQDRWIDLHISFFPGAADDEQKVAAFEKSLAYQTFEEKLKSK